MSYSAHKSVDSAHNHQNEAQVSNKQWDKLTEIASKFQRSNRLPTEKVKSLILELCQDEWLTTKELSLLTNRHSNGLRFRYLTPMVKEGLLALKYPDKPNRSDQAYTTASVLSKS